MQRKSYAALFAALVIGIGAIGTDAAEVRSVTIVAPDSGTVLGIDGTFKVEAVVRDFTPFDGDGVVIALVDSSGALLGDQTTGGGIGDDTGHNSAVGVNVDNPTLVTINGGTKEGTDDDLARQTEGGGSGIVAVRIHKSNGTTDSTKYYGGDATRVEVDEDYGDIEEVLYTWTSKVNVSSTLGAEIQAVAVAVDQTTDQASSIGVTAESIEWSPISKGSKLFEIDAERPLPPEQLIDTSAGGLSEVLLGRATTTPDDDTRQDVAGIGHNLSFKVRVGPLRMRRLLEQDHKVVIEINEMTTATTVGKPQGKPFEVSLADRKLDTLYFNHRIVDGDFGDLIGAKLDNRAGFEKPARNRATAYIIDAAGNRSRDRDAGSGLGEDYDSGGDRDLVGGQWVPLTYLIDGKAPVIDGVSGKIDDVVVSDTLTVASPDTVTDGTTNKPEFSDDLNSINYKLFEDLSALDIDLGGTVLKLRQDADAAALDVRRVGKLTVGDDDRVVISSTDFDTLFTDGDDALRKAGRLVRVRFAAGAKAALETVKGLDIVAHDTTGLGALKTGVKTVKVTGTDLAGNEGLPAVRADVYVDVDDLAFNGLFPTAGAVAKAGEVAKIEEETANVRFTLSEHADSVLLTYRVTSAASNGPERNGDKKIRALVGGELLDTEEQIIYHDEFINAAKKDTGLVHGSKYQLTLLGADLAGNYHVTDAKKMTYDTSYVVPQITSFKIVTDPEKQGGTLKDNQIDAGAKVNFTITAQHDDETAALTYGKAEDYNNDAMLVVSGGSGEGLKLTGKGLITEGMPMGTAALSKRAWGLGVATATLEATVAHETLTVTIHDSSLAASPYVAKLDSVLVIADLPTAKIAIDVDSTAQMGEEFQVGLSFVDKYGNLNNDLNTFVQVGTGAIGLDVPTLVPVTNGTATFSVRSNEHVGELTLTVRDVGENSTNKAASTTLTITAAAPPPDPVAPDGPNEVVGDDYKGVAGRGDQGGFIVLTWDVSDDHATIDRYRIWREILVNRDVVDGKIVELDPPELRNVSWATVGAIPGETVMRVVVATLDPDSTRWGVSAERGGLVSDDGSDADDGMDGDGTTTDTTMTDTTMTDTTMADTTMTDTSGTSTKRAFMAMQSLSVPYELMAETMVRSRQAAGDGASMATLTPEALAFERGGLVPNLKATGSITFTAQAVAATDDIPPAPVTGLTAMDTPGDAGASITIEWTPSVDDKVLTSMVADAVGTNGNVYTSAGVAGYKVSRRLGDGAWTEAGTAPAGSRMFEDQNVDNGVRYSYKVEAFDLNNLTPSEEVQSAMAIRNTVVDKDGQRIVGLFGADDAVGFDDFFIFADHIGLTSDNDLFEAAFDLNGDKVINTADFFAFAESFGKVVEASGKAVPTRAGLNSEARFSMAAGTDLPLVGEEMALRVSLEDFAEVRGYGFTVHFDESYLEFVEPRVESNPLGETALAQPRVISKGAGELHIAAFGETAVDEGDLGLSLVFRTVREIEESLVEIMAGDIQDGSYGLTRLTDPVSVRIETRPEVYALENNYPNPFNPETTLKYQLPDANEVTLEVFNMLGQVVRTLVDREFQNAGRYTYRWDATNDGGQPLSSGIYFYRVTAGGEFQSHKKMLLLK